MSTRFAEYAIKSYIPRVWHYFLDFLAIERKPDKLRVQPSLPCTEKCERAIKISTAHADTIHRAVESDEWCDDNFDPGRVSRIRKKRFPKSVLVAHKFCVRRQFTERHFSAFAHDRRENALLRSPCTFDDFTRIDFVPGRKVASDDAIGKKVSTPQELLADVT